MEIFMKECGRMINFKVKAFLKLISINMKDYLKQVNSMEKGQLLG